MSKPTITKPNRSIEGTLMDAILSNVDLNQAVKANQKAIQKVIGKRLLEVCTHIDWGEMMYDTIYDDDRVRGIIQARVQSAMEEAFTVPTTRRSRR